MKKVIQTLALVSIAFAFTSCCSHCPVGKKKCKAGAVKSCKVGCKKACCAKKKCCGGHGGKACCAKKKA